MMNTTDYENIWQKSLIHVTDEFTLPPVILQAGEAIIGTLGNFSVSTGKAKAKKTFNVSAIVAAALVNGQVLEYQASFPESKRTILYFDTEQSPYHCQLVMQRILRLAKLPIDKEPQNLKFSHLRAIADPNERREIIRYAIYNTPNVGLVVIDGIRDLMLDINNSTEATKLVGDLMQWTSEQNIHIQTVLHLNKGDDNARGYIGTELNNKAETVIQITKDNTLPDRSIVAPAIIRSKPFDKFAFRLKEVEKLYNDTKKYYDALKKVNNLIGDAYKVKECILMVGDISEIYVTSYKKMLSDKNFRPSELAAMASGYAKLLEQSGESLKELKSIVKSNVFSMNDHERMLAIDRIYTTLRENRSLVSYYTRKNISVSYVRAREKNNLASVKALYGNTASRYW